APAATVIGTRKRFQWNHAATAAIAPEAATTIPPSRLLLFSWSGPIASAIAIAAVANTPKTKASRRRIDGSAIRRRAVKNNARPQAVVATPSGPSGDGPSEPMVRPADWPIDWPIQPTANSRIAAAIDTKMSLK